MTTFDAIYGRRAIKQFDPNHRLTDEELDKLFQAVIQSPTSFNMQNWRFVLVLDTELKKEIRQAAYDQAQVTDASILVVMTADLKAWSKQPARYWQYAPAEVNELLSNWMVNFYEGNHQLQRDEAMRSLGLAGQTLMLAAKAMGYDTCPMVGFDPARVAQLINLPADHVVGYLITVGKAVTKPWPKPGQLPLNEVLIRNRFETPGTPH